MNKYLKALLIGAMLLGAALLVGLALATHSNTDFESQYSILLILNIAVIVVMIALLIILSFWLFQRFRNHVFGTRLLTRFALSFALLGIVPSILLFAISTTFVSRTIDSWFNLKLDAALEAGINFGREGLARANEQTVEQLVRLAEREAHALHSVGSAQAQNWLNYYHWQSIAALDKNAQIIWQYDVDASIHIKPEFTQEILLEAAQGWSMFEDESDASDDRTVNNGSTPKIHALKSIKSNSKVAYLYALRVMPIDFSEKVDAIQTGLRDYQATKSSRSSLKNLYRITLAIVLLLTSLAALAAAFLIASRMIQPILWLAKATRMVATGHYALVPQRVKGSDELIQLVDSFGDMVQQLNVTQASLQANQKELEAAKAYSEAILYNLSAGVLVFDHDLTLESYNSYANRMFQTNLEVYVGRHMRDIEPLVALFEPIQAAMSNQEQQPWRVQQNVTLNAVDHTDDLTISIQGTRFVAEDGYESFVLVCDDISTIISAQRTLAWGEVARRLAHEIKNPLTPIQLSAERLNMKLADKLNDNDQNLLERSTRTIVNQVQALQNMVNEFRDYARTPEVIFAPVDLNALIEEILVLYESGQGTKYHIHTILDVRIPAILADAQQLRQVLHNLIKNALEAALEERVVTLTIKTELRELESKGLIPSHAVNLTVKDNGTGFSPKVLARMFEPYNTSKNTGTGLGLPVIKKIIDAHHGKISVKNNICSNAQNPSQSEILGAQIDILFLNVVTGSDDSPQTMKLL